MRRAARDPAAERLLTDSFEVVEAMSEQRL
jgi:hypothetical protein